nr:RNA-directed DNA polymerase, eukaryota, reverse transcriptase zinc-binding domain protein [Tanacetum cinerariifolium]
QLIDSLHREFDMTDLRALNYFLGISVVRNSTGLYLSQRNSTDLPLYARSAITIFSCSQAHLTICSSAEAEYRGFAYVVAETAWLRNLLRELHSLLSTTSTVITLEFYMYLLATKWALERNGVSGWMNVLGPRPCLYLLMDLLRRNSGWRGVLGKATLFRLFLFILAAEGLNAIVNEAVLKGIFRGVKMGRNNVTVSDKWKWTLVEDGEFKVKALTRLVEGKILQVESGVQETAWNNLVPRKVNIFIWKAIKGRLPVRVELDRIGIDLDSVLCPSCNNSVESCAHSLVTCDLAMSVWEKVFSWWKMGCANAFSIGKLFSSYGNVNIPVAFSYVCQAVLWSTGYFIWKERNDCVFVGAGGGQPIKLNRNSSNKAEGSPLVKISAYWVGRHINTTNVITVDVVDKRECSSRRRLRSHAVSATT